MAPSWNLSLAVGVPEIDAQHQELFARIDKLLQAMKAGDRSEIGRLFAYLEDYTVNHFATEERWMEAIRYPDYPLHKAAHDSFVRNFVKLKSQFQAKGPIALVTIQVNNWLTDWLKAHIAGTDVRLARHLLAHGHTSSPG